MKRILLRLFVFGATLVILAAAGAGVYLHYKIADLKKQVIVSVENSLGAKIEVSSLTMDLRHQRLMASGIFLANERPDAPWDKARIGLAVANFKWRDLLSPTIPLTVQVSAWKVILCSPASVSSRPSPEGETEAATPSVHSSFRVTQLSAQDGEAEIDLSDASQVFIHQVTFSANADDSGAWTTDLKVGSITAGTLATGPGTVRIKGDPEKIAFTNLHLQCDPGALDGDGEISLTDHHAAQISLKASQVPVAMLVATAWRMKLSGLAVGNLDYQGSDAGSSAHGHIELTKGRFNLLLFLSKVTTLLDLPDLSGVDLDQASTDFDWKDHVLQLSHLDLRKTDVARINGDMKVDASGQIDGQLKFGLPSAILAKWPSVQDQVFPVALENYNWTEVHVTGTPDHLEEDLTPRLLAAGAQQSGAMLNDAVKKAGDLLNDFLHK